MHASIAKTPRKKHKAFASWLIRYPRVRGRGNERNAVAAMNLFKMIYSPLNNRKSYSGVVTCLVYTYIIYM